MTQQPRIKTHSNTRQNTLPAESALFSHGPQHPNTLLCELLGTQTFFPKLPFQSLCFSLSPILSYVWPLTKSCRCFIMLEHCSPPPKFQQNALGRNCVVIWGLSFNLLLSTGTSYSRKTDTAFSRCRVPGLPQRKPVCGGTWVSALLTETSYLSVFSSSYMP